MLGHLGLEFKYVTPHSTEDPCIQGLSSHLTSSHLTLSTGPYLDFQTESSQLRKQLGSANPTPAALTDPLHLDPRGVADK